MGALMGRRKGEPTAAGIDRGWPHQVVVPATECTGSHGRFMEAFCLDLCVREASQRLSRGQAVDCVLLCGSGARREIPGQIRGERFDPKDRGRGPSWARWYKNGR